MINFEKAVEQACYVPPMMRITGISVRNAILSNSTIEGSAINDVKEEENAFFIISQ